MSTTAEFAVQVSDRLKGYQSQLKLTGFLQKKAENGSIIRQKFFLCWWIVKTDEEKKALTFG